MELCPSLWPSKAVDLTTWHTDQNTSYFESVSPKERLASKKGQNPNQFVGLDIRLQIIVFIYNNFEGTQNKRKLYTGHFPQLLARKQTNIWN